MMVLHFTLLLLPFAICTSPTIELWQRIDRMRTRNTLDTVLNHSPYRLHYTKCVRNFKESHLSHCERATNLFSCIKNMLALDNWNKLIISSVARSMTNAFTGPLTCIKLNTTVTTTTTTQTDHIDFTTEVPDITTANPMNAAVVDMRSIYIISIILLIMQVVLTIAFIIFSICIWRGKIHGTRYHLLSNVDHCSTTQPFPEQSI